MKDRAQLSCEQSAQYQESTEGYSPATWSHPDLLEPVTKQIKLGDQDRVRSQTGGSAVQICVHGNVWKAAVWKYKRIT
jgi:hypothetical protein